MIVAERKVDGNVAEESSSWRGPQAKKRSVIFIPMGTVTWEGMTTTRIFAESALE
jgi:hypothetical protein